MSVLRLIRPPSHMKGMVGEDRRETPTRKARTEVEETLLGPHRSPGEDFHPVVSAVDEHPAPPAGAAAGHRPVLAEQHRLSARAGALQHVQVAHDAGQCEAPVRDQLVELLEHRRLVEPRQHGQVEIVAQLDAREALPVVGRVGGRVPDNRKQALSLVGAEPLGAPLIVGFERTCRAQGASHLGQSPQPLDHLPASPSRPPRAPRSRVRFASTISSSGTSSGATSPSSTSPRWSAVTTVASCRGVISSCSS